MSGKIVSNGRSTIPQLKERFKKVFLNYKKFEDGSIQSTAFLVSENCVHVGVSMFSNRGDNYNKSRGRQMALGRAEYAFNVYSGKETARASHTKRRQELSFTIVASTENTVEKIVESLLISSAPKQLSDNSNK
jgi:hypothetical protein